MNSTAVSRLLSLLYGVASNRRLLLHRSASSSSSSSSSSSRIPKTTTVSPRNRTTNIFEDQSDGRGYTVYNHALRYSPLPTIKLHQQRAHLRKPVSLIGTMERTPTAYNKPSDYKGDIGVDSILSVKTSRDSNNPVKVLVEIWEHVNCGDYIYVSVSLESYRRHVFF